MDERFLDCAIQDRFDERKRAQEALERDATRYRAVRKMITEQGFLSRDLQRCMADVRCTAAEVDEAVDATVKRTAGVALPDGAQK